MEKVNAAVIMAGHHLVLLVRGKPVAFAHNIKSSVQLFKDRIRNSRGLVFSNDNQTSFPWLREICQQRKEP